MREITTVRRGPGGRRAFAAVVACALVLAVVAGGCGVVWDAPEVRIVATSQGISFGGENDRRKAHGGETIINLMNNTEQERRLVLAEVDAVGELPQELLEAEFARDDGRIVDMTGDMRGRRASLTQALQFEYSFASFHVHLHPGRVYVVFDTLNDDGIEPLWFIPGEGGATT